MAILRAKEIRKLSDKDIQKRATELKLEMAKELANISIGATTTSPGKIKQIRRTIARINTIQRESTQSTKRLAISNEKSRPPTKGAVVKK